MNKLIPVSVAIGMFALPLGMALAEEGALRVTGGAQVSVQSGLGVSGTSGSEGEGAVNAELDGNASAVATQKSQEERSEHATTTRGKSEDDHGTSTASSSKSRGEKESADSNNENGFGRGGIVGFFRWIFGMDDSASVSDIRAGVNASSTARATIEDSNSQGLGFFAKLLGFFSI